MASGPADRWHRSPDLAIVESAGRVAIQHLARLDQDPVILEGTAHAIWRALGEHHDLDAINGTVAERYGIDPQSSRGATLAFLQAVSTLCLVQRHEAAGEAPVADRDHPL